MSFFGKLVTLAVGVYAGVYIDQTYQLPRANDPQELYKKLSEWLEDYKKK